MLKRIAALLLALCLWTALLPSAQAGSLTKPERYEAALTELKNYLNDMGATPLDDLFMQFSTLGAYDHSAMFAIYVNVLRGIESGNFSRVGYHIDLLKLNGEFCALLQEDDALGTVDALQSYAAGREAEANGNTAAALTHYTACISFRDSMLRLSALQEGLLAQTYQEALRCYMLDTYEGYQQAYELFLELSRYGGYEDSESLLVLADVLRATPVPTATPTPTPSPTPTPTPRATPTPVPTPTPAPTINPDDYIYSVNKKENCVTISGYRGSETELVLPATLEGYPVTAINSEAFRNNRFTSVVIPEGVRSIGSCAFADSNTLASVVLPESLTDIGWACFSNCYTLASINIPSGITTLRSTFSGCPSLTDITLPDSLAVIDSYTFYSCSLTSISLPDGLTTIGDEAFMYCDLTHIDIPASVTTIGEGAFGYCDQLTMITISPYNSQYYMDGGTLYSRDGCLLACMERSTVSFTIPSFATRIGSYAFADFRQLTSIHLPDGLQSIGANAFDSCALTSITIPDSVTEIGDYAFDSCDLTSITIPDSVTELGPGVFFQNSKLTTVKLPRKLKTIPNWLFECCSSLTKVTLPASVESIGDRAFSSSALTQITLPAKVKELGTGIFYDCKALETVKFECRPTSIPNDMFRNCDALESISLPSSVTSIGDYAFFACFTLKSIRVPAGITTLGWQTFDSCPNLVLKVRRGSGMETWCKESGFPYSTY